MKTCKATGQTLPLSEYYTRSIIRKDGTTYVRTDPVCKEYRKMKMKKYYQYQKAMKAYNEIVEQIPEEDKLVISKTYNTGSYKLTAEEFDDVVELEKLTNKHSSDLWDSYDKTPTFWDKVVSFFNKIFNAS